MIKDLLKEAFILKKNGYHKHSIELFYKAMEVDNSSIELMLEIAECYFHINDVERTLNYIEQILEKSPTHIPSLRLLLKVFIKKQAWLEAEQTAKNIYCISQKDSDLVEIFRFLNKQQRYSDIFTYDINSEKPELLYEQAYAKYYQNEIIKAEELINKALSIKPNNSKFLLLKGQILLKENKDELALELISEINNQEENPEIFNFVGLVYQRCGEYKKAIENFLKALKNSPNKDEVYYNCASTYFKLGENHLAKKYYNLAISTNPENQSYHFALANLYYSEKNYKRALEELKCDFYEAKLLRAIILYDTKYLAIAKKEFENIQKERPDDMVVEYINRINHELSI